MDILNRLKQKYGLHLGLELLDYITIELDGRNFIDVHVKIPYGNPLRDMVHNKNYYVDRGVYPTTASVEEKLKECAINGTDFEACKRIIHFSKL